MFCCKRTQGTHSAESIKVKSLKPLSVLLQFLACLNIARVLPSEVTASVDFLSVLALLSFHFSNSRPISSGLFLLDFSRYFLQSCVKSIFFNPRSIFCSSASLEDFSKSHIASTSSKSGMDTKAVQTLLPTFPVLQQ